MPMKERSNRPTAHKLALVAAALTPAVASLQAFFLVNAMWSDREILSTISNAASFLYLPLAYRVSYIALAAAVIFCVVARSITTGARLAFLLHVILILLIVWSIGSFYFGQDFPSYSQSTSAAKFVFPVTRISAGIWLIIVAKALWPFTKQSTSGI
jgi:hypothetical protein